jgi:hypothetical protein
VSKAGVLGEKLRLATDSQGYARRGA